MTKVLVVAAVLISIVIVSLVVTASHWWKRVSDLTVTSNGHPASATNIYRSRRGSVLVHLNEGEGLYVIHPESGEIGIANRSHFFMLPGYAYSRNVPPLLAPMGKADVDPQLKIEDNYIEFNSINNNRVRVTW